MNLISGSTFTNNGKFSTSEAGVACAKGVTLSVLNSTFSRNLATYQGGVFFLFLHMVRCPYHNLFLTIMEVEECLSSREGAHFKLVKAPSHTMMQTYM